MPTVKTQGQSATGRRETGDAVLAAAATNAVDAKKVKGQLATFAKAHKAYVVSLAKVSAAESVRDMAQRAVGEADAAQDRMVDELARVLINEGAKRQSPLAGLTKVTVSDLKRLAVEKEAKELQKIAGLLLKRPKLSKELKATAKATNDAAAASLKALVSVGPREKLYQDTLNGRDALGQPWETSLAFLKNAVRVAEDQGAKGLFENLFQRTAVAPKAKKPAKAPKAKKPSPAE